MCMARSSVSEEKIGPKPLPHDTRRENVTQRSAGSKRAYNGVHGTNFFRSSSTTKRQIHLRHKRSWSRKDRCTNVDSGASLHLMGRSSPIAQERTTSGNMSHKIQGAHAGMQCTKIQSNASRPKTIIQSKDRMYIGDSGGSLHMIWVKVVCLSNRKKELHVKDQKLPGNSNRDRYRPFHQTGEGLHPGARHLPVREVRGILSFDTVVGTIVR